MVGWKSFTIEIYGLLIYVRNVRKFAKQAFQLHFFSRDRTSLLDNNDEQMFEVISVNHEPEIKKTNSTEIRKAEEALCKGKFFSHCLNVRNKSVQFRRATAPGSIPEAG